MRAFSGDGVGGEGRVSESHDTIRVQKLQCEVAPLVQHVPNSFDVDLSPGLAQLVTLGDVLPKGSNVVPFCAVY